MLDSLVELLDHIAASDHGPITEATELLGDLGLAGDDLYEAIAAIHERFGTDFSAMKLRDYAPPEVDGLFSLYPLREFLGRPRRYRSLTVGDLAGAAEAGRWSVA